MRIIIVSGNIQSIYHAVNIWDTSLLIDFFFVSTWILMLICWCEQLNQMFEQVVGRCFSTTNSARKGNRFIVWNEKTVFRCIPTHFHIEVAGVPNAKNCRLCFPGQCRVIPLNGTLKHSRTRQATVGPKRGEPVTKITWHRWSRSDDSINSWNVAASSFRQRGSCVAVWGAAGPLGEV